MSRSKLLATTFAAVAFSFSGANADMKGMEKCAVVDASGKNLVKAEKGDCKTANNSCAGHNKAGEAEAWVMVPTGECAKINAGDFSGVSEEVKAKIEMPAEASTEASTEAAAE